MPSRHKARSLRGPCPVAPIPETLEELEGSGAGGCLCASRTHDLTARWVPAAAPASPTALALLEPSPRPPDGAILGGRRAQAALRGCSSTGRGIQLCLSQHEDVHLGSWYPQKRLLWVSQGQMQSHSTGGTGQTTTAGPSDEEGDNGPSGAARHLS